MLLLHRGATVTLCHSKTENAAALRAKRTSSSPRPGGARASGAAYFRAGQTVIDVGIHYNEETQKLCGDVALAEADGVVRAVTPVPAASARSPRRCWPAHTGKSRGAPDKNNSIQKTHDRVGAKRKVPRDGMLSVDERREPLRFCSASAATRGYRSFRGNCHERSLLRHENKKTRPERRAGGNVRRARRARARSQQHQDHL